MVLLDDSRLTRDLDPLWWRVPAWVALTAGSVVQTHGVGLRVATGVLMGVGAIALQVVRHPDVRVRIGSLLVTTLTGLAACFTAHQGLAEILVVVAAARSPYVFEGRVLGWFVALDAVAFGGAVGYISNSLPGLLAGLAIPALAQRTREHLELVRERDRAQALLAEAQRARESEAQAAALQERGRIARDMHDVLAHSLAGLSMQLQGIRAVAAREQVSSTVLEPLDKAAALARDGLGEARAAVSALRDPGGLGLPELPALVERHPGQASLVVNGGSGDGGNVGPEAGHAVYRAVQESLTNAARYAPGSAVAVTVDWSADGLTVTVDDDGPGAGREPVRGQGTGLGLAGMAERIKQAGGTLSAGPRAEGGWRIAINVPQQMDAEVTP